MASLKSPRVSLPIPLPKTSSFKQMDQNPTLNMPPNMDALILRSNRILYVTLI